MGRNASGTYTLPIGAFSPGGLIKSSDHNSNYSDIATALTQSLATTGVSTMTGQVKAAAGTAAAAQRWGDVTARRPNRAPAARAAVARAAAARAVAASSRRHSQHVSRTAYAAMLTMRHAALSAGR